MPSTPDKQNNMEQEKATPELNLIDANMLAFIAGIMDNGTETEERAVLSCMGLNRTDKHLIKNGLRNRHFTANNIHDLMRTYNGNANFIFGLESEMERPKKSN